MAHQQQVVEHYWTWCSKYYIPYPCRKTRTVTKWCYDFSYLTVDYHYVYTNYVGCELNQLYVWRDWELSFSGGQFTLYFITKCYDNLRPAKGPCSPEIAIANLRNVLGEDFESIVRGERPFGRSAAAERRADEPGGDRPIPPQ